MREYAIIFYACKRTHHCYELGFDSAPPNYYPSDCLIYRAAIFVMEKLSLARVTLDTERLHLRPFEPSDLDVYTARIFADSDVMRFLPKRDAPARERAQRTMDFFNDHWNQFPYAPWAVVEKASGELIGQCGLCFISEIQETEVLYAFGKEFWGKGYATEAARASVAFGFNQVGLERIIALAVPENSASRKVMEHCGLQYEKEMQLFGMNCVYYARNRAH